MERFKMMGGTSTSSGFITQMEGFKRSYHLDGRAGTRKFTSDDNGWGYKEWD